MFFSVIKMENGSRKVGLRITAGFLLGITIIVAVFASGITLPSQQISETPSLTLKEDTGKLTVLLMDAPVDVDELWITIEGISVHKVAGAENNVGVEEPETTSDDDNKGWLNLDLSTVDKSYLKFNLLDYQINGESDDKVLSLADDIIYEGKYNKIRLNVTDAYALYYEHDEDGEIVEDEDGPVIERNQTLKVPPKHIDIITEFTIDADYPVVVLIDMQPDWVSISHSGNLRPVMKATVSQSIPKDTQVETIETPTNPQTQGEQTT
jgi:hypothetical protein